jgi:septin 3/9/12
MKDGNKILTSSWEPLVKYIKDQYSLYLRKELTPQREPRINDTRVHVVLFFIAPTGHAMSPLDIIVLRKLSKVSIFLIIGTFIVITVL